MQAHRFLREATRQAHAAAENTPLMHRMLQGHPDLGAYVLLLDRYHAFFQSWESTHVEWLQGTVLRAGWRYRSRLPALEQDLDALHAPPPDESHAASHPFAGTAQSWGELYVIEGSALGGQIIGRALTERFPGHLPQFFNTQPAPPGQSWRYFQHMLDRNLADTTLAQRAASGANALFSRILELLSEVHS